MAYKKKNNPGENGYQRFLAAMKSKSYGRLYIFYGEEKYLMNWSRSTLKKNLVEGPTEDFNYHRFDEESFELNAFEDALEAPPMMSESTMIELTDVNLFDSSVDKAVLAELLKDIPEYCTVLLTYDTLPWKPDKRAKVLWGVLGSVGEQFEFEEQSEAELVKWIQKRFAADSFQIESGNAKYLIQQAGSSMQNLASETDKLKSYCRSEQVSREDIDAVVIPVLSSAIYQITEAISVQDYNQAVQMLRNVLSQDVEPVRISASISGQMRQLYAAKLLAENRKSAYALSQLYGLYERRANTIFAQARNFKRQQLKEAISLCAEADLRLKSFSGDDEAVLVELLIQLSRL